MTEILTRKSDETLEEYKNRLLRNKSFYDITWDEIAVCLNQELGTDYSPDKYRKESYRLERAEISEEVDEKLLELRKAKVKLSDERTQINAIARKLAREEVFKELALDTVKEMSKNKILELPAEITIKNTEKQGILCIGDWHYGLDVKEFFNIYSPEIAKLRVQALLEKVLSIIAEHNLQQVTVINLGDMISGRIHLPLRLNSRIDAVTQTMEVSELMAEFLTALSTKVKINYFSVEDNHSRIEPNKRDSINTESFARIIDWYLQERLKDNINITFCESTMEDIATFNVYNHVVVAVHGDKDPQKGIVDRLNSYLQQHIDLIISAHMHHFSADENNFTEFYCNGSLIGQDQYASSLRLNSKPSQLMFISTPENVSEVIYKIKL